MPPPRGRPVVVAVVAVALLALAALALAYERAAISDRGRLEAMASRATGLHVHVLGRIHLGGIPGHRITAEDVHASDDRGVEIVSAKRVRVSFEPVPLLHRQFRMRELELFEPHMRVVPGPDHRIEAGRLTHLTGLLAGLDGVRVEITDGALELGGSGDHPAFAIAHGDLHLDPVVFPHGSGPGALRGLVLRGRFDCREMHLGGAALTHLETRIGTRNDTLSFAPMTMTLFRGHGRAELDLALAAAEPSYALHLALPRFRIEDFLATVSSAPAAEGTMDFSATLTARGHNAAALMHDASGAMSLRGAGVTLVGNDLDRALAHARSIQGFHLVDVGAVLLAGPVGMAVSRGYGLAGAMRGSAGNTHIRTVVSDWRVTDGVAHAEDVALATSENRIALVGGLDFVHQRFDGVTVAAIDGNGCARIRQQMHGTFARPELERPRLIGVLTSPVLKLVGRTRRLLPGHCEPFYTGTVAAPEAER